MASNKDSLGTRIKKYENVSRLHLTPRTPVMIRVDGKAFHTLTKNCEKPFDQHFINAMAWAAEATAIHIQGFKVAYVQSDEATFVCTDYDDINTQGWFDYNLQKMVSVSASTMAVYFNHYYYDSHVPRPYHVGLPVFDSRTFNIPANDIANALLWRAQDWNRNSIQMYARANFSQKQLHKKTKPDMHNMLHEIGKNWTRDLTEQQRNGTFFILNSDGKIQKYTDILPMYASIDEAICHLF